MNSNYLIKPRFYLVVMFYALFCSACSQDQISNVDSGTENQILHMGNGTEPQDLDPHTVTGVPERRLGVALFEGLLTYNTKTLELMPGVAKSWEISDDNLTYTFHIRQNSRWSNGDPVTAHDFVYSWNRILHPQLANEYAYSYYSIVNAEAFNTSKTTDFNQVGIKASDDHTLVFTMEKDWPVFLELMADIYPVHKKTIESHGDMWDRGTSWTRPGNHIGNGPFKLDEWVPNKIITVTRNEYYWDSDKVKLNGIHFHPIENATTEERMFRTRQLHIINGLVSEKIEQYKNETPELLRIFPIYGTYYYLINTTRPELSDIRVRKALAMTINREQIVNNITKGGQIPAYSLNPIDPNGYEPQSGIEYNPGKAKELLAEAGYPDGQGFPAFEILYNTLEGHQQIALAIQQMWQSILNIEVTLVNQEWMVFLDTQKQKNYDISRMGALAGIADPGDFLDSFTSNSGMNNTGWANPEYDALIKKAVNISDKNERFRIYQEAEKIITNEVPLIPIYYYTRVRLISTDVKGWNNNLLDNISYKDIYLARN
ncbi:MAG: oligopeptide transport system substrate-binding protein [Gammaproteobacteria bacterium]|jgi:oligopeptide transport system substrate-binding protein